MFALRDLISVYLLAKRPTLNLAPVRDISAGFKRIMGLLFKIAPLFR
jgi:hypothetical protein